MSRLAPITSFSIMLRINQWIIQENSDLLSDIYGFHCCRMVYRKPSINVHILPKDNPVLCFIRSYNPPVAIRLSSRIGFIFNSAKWVNRPTSMINTAVAITWQRVNLVVYVGNVINATSTRYCDDFKDKMFYAILRHLLSM